MSVPLPPFDGTQPCASTPPEMWFLEASEDRDVKPLLRSICQKCDFLKECEQYSLAYRLDGFWAGRTQHERVIEQNRRGIKPLPVYLTPGDLSGLAG